MLMKKSLVTLAVLVISAALLNVSRAQSGPLEDLTNFPKTDVAILHGKKRDNPRVINSWIANTPARQEQGLMFVQDLPQGQGMFFPLKKPKKMAMWMKNTFVELDMLFIGENGAIDQIVEHARPLSTDIINSNKELSAVLELKGGEVQRLGIKVGDHIDWTPPEGCDCVAPPPVIKKTT
jgi:uncharacterized membrane protein (UPF0127 family)